MKSVKISDDLASAKEKESLDSIQYWQSQGATKIWDAMFEMLDFWYISRGLDPETQRVDKTVFGVKKNPWNK